MYDPMSEAHEFIGSSRAEAVAKATAFFGASEAELAISEIDATRASGIGTRFVIVAYRRAAGAPGRRASGAEANDRGRGARGEREARGGERNGRERGGRAERGERERGGRGERGGRNRSRREPVAEEAAAPAAAAAPSV